MRSKNESLHHRLSFVSLKKVSQRSRQTPRMHSNPFFTVGLPRQKHPEAKHHASPRADQSSGARAMEREKAKMRARYCRALILIQFPISSWVTTLTKYFAPIGLVYMPSSSLVAR